MNFLVILYLRGLKLNSYIIKHIPGSESDDSFRVSVKSEVTNREDREKFLLSVDPRAAENEQKATADDINNSKCQTILSEFSEEMTNLIENLSNPADDNSSHITTDKNE